MESLATGEQHGGGGIQKASTQVKAMPGSAGEHLHLLRAGKPDVVLHTTTGMLASVLERITV